MKEARSRFRTILITTLVLLIGFLVLQSLGYGIGFFLDPASGTGEFATPPSVEDDPLTVALVGLVGVGMLGAAGLLTLAAVLVVKGVPAGTYVVMAIGVVYMLAGVSVHRAGWTWDARFYLVGGGLLLALAGAVRLLRPSAHGPN